MSKTLFRTLLFSGLLTLFLTLSFSFAVKNLFETITERNIYEKNIKELNIISDFVQARHDSIQKLTYQLAEDPSLNTFLLHGSMDTAQGYETMLNLKKYIDINSMFHSLSLYSGYTGEYFSTLTSRSGEDRYFREMLENLDTTTMLQPYYRSLPSDIYYVSDNVFSYFYFETDNKGKVTKAITINLDADMFCEYLNTLKGNNAHTYIIDLNNQYIIDGSSETRALNDTTFTFSQKILDSNTERGCFVDDPSGNEMLITYQVLKNPNWILIMEEQNTDVHNTMNIIYRFLLIFVLLLIVVGMLFSSIFYRRLYRPWSSLYHQLSSDRKSSLSPSRLYDDVEAIQNSIRLTQNQLTEFLKYQNSAKNALLESYIRALLREDTHFIEKLAVSDRSAFEGFLAQPTEIAVFQIEHWKQVKSNLPGSSDACTYTLIQISSRLFPSHHEKPAYKWVYLGKGQFLLLLFHSLLESQEQPFIEYLAELQQHFTSQTGLPVTIAIGGTSGTIKELVTACHTALELFQTSILHERQSILVPTSSSEETNTEIAYDEKSEKALIEALCNGQTQEANQILNELLDKYRRGPQETFTLYLTQLFLRIDKRLYVSGKLQGPQSEIPFIFYHILSEAESLDDIREMFADNLEKLSFADNNATQKTALTVASIKDYINEHYPEDISLKFLSAKFNLSQGYLGAIFRDTVGISVYEYINQVRLDASAQMLLSTDLSTKAIMEKCGFINESNFYKLFKTRFDVTPKTYRTQKRLSR